MLLNHFRIAMRNLWRNPVFSAINIAGLAIGMATCLIIMLFVHNELSYDRYNVKADRMVRVIFRGSAAGGKMNEANVMPPVAQTLLHDFPEVEEATRLRQGPESIVHYGDKTFKETSFAYVDSNFFQVFTLPLLRGDARDALLEPNSLVITRAIAHKYFGDADPIGKILNFSSLHADFKITGVIDKVPVNSHFHFDLFASMVGVQGDRIEARSTSWMNSGFNTYLVLKPGYDYKKLEAKLPGLVTKYVGAQMFQAIGMTLDQFRQKGNDIGLYLQPLTDIHLHSDCTNDMEPSGDIRYVYISGAIAVFMLLIACINFMNLSTAGASRRSREVGIRKVLGSMRGGLVRQFLLESILLATIALLLAIGLLYLALPAFDKMAGKDLDLSFKETPWLLPALVVFGLLTGILAGSYPAFFLSSFKPISVLKGQLLPGNKSFGLRSSLVVFQFLISIVLIICSAVAYDQLSYIQHKKLGYDKDQVLILPETWMLGNNQQAFRRQILQDPRVANLSVSDYLPAGPSGDNNFFIYPENSAQLVKTLQYEIDSNYIPTMGMQMAAGRNFEGDYGTDSASAILNETAVRLLGWDSHPLGRTFSNEDRSHKITYRVIGVVKDFHFRSLHERISPLVMTLTNRPAKMIIKTKTRDLAGLISTLQKTWSSYIRDAPMEYFFLDEGFSNTYNAERKIALILGVFAGLTIIVACMGLFGLATFTAEQRVKEIGIRKVLGATVGGIVSLLSKDFLRLVTIAFIIAGPISWLVMNKWLEDFAYHIDISAWTYIGVAVLVLAITLITVSFQAIRAALTNPVKTLRSE